MNALATREMHAARVAPLAPPADTRPLASGERLYEQGEAAAGVYRVLSGALRLVRHEGEARRRLVGFVCAGELLGTPFRPLHSHAAEALGACTVERTSATACGDGPLDAEIALARQRVNHLEAQATLVGRTCALERLCGFLLMMEVRLSRPWRASGGDFRLPMDREDIADFLGLTAETVSRRLTALREAGIIDLPAPREVRVLARERLERCAGGGWKG